MSKTDEDLKREAQEDLKGGIETYDVKRVENALKGVQIQTELPQTITLLYN